MVLVAVLKLGACCRLGCTGVVVEVVVFVTSVDFNVTENGMLTVELDVVVVDGAVVVEVVVVVGGAVVVELVVV